MIGIIVDGVGDHSAFKARYSDGVKVIKADGPRGHTVSADTLSASCRKQICILRALGCNEVIIVTDFEGRSGRCDDFCRKIEENLSDVTGVKAFCADKMIENWILADIEYLAPKKVYLKSPLKQKNYESKNGKSELKKLFAPGYDYNEVKHGAELFKLVRGGDAAKRSSSFDKFRRGAGLD